MNWFSHLMRMWRVRRSKNKKLLTRIQRDLCLLPRQIDRSTLSLTVLHSLLALVCLWDWFSMCVCVPTRALCMCVCVCVLRCMFINVCSYSNAWNLLVYVKVREKGKTVSFFQRILFLALSYEEISWPIFLILVTGNLRILYYLIPVLALKSRGWLLPFGRWVNWVSERLQSLPKVYSACR